ncbi:phage tail assembly protein [Shinella pollutisoli]|uniref:Phage tail assembly protein n=1 Tax=Shinella pollutisoli TaxID=2250594 RepID=A0ABV7DN14_9HYPH|nr:phage tail assembly protein [Shinella pollutisoli]
MSQITKAATPQEIAAAEARQVKSAPQEPARQILPEGFEAEKSIDLVVPIEFRGTVYERVNIRRLKGRDFLKLQQMAGNEDMILLAIVTGLPTEVLEELAGDDFVALTEAAQAFLPRRLREAAGTISADGQDSQA